MIKFITLMFCAFILGSCNKHSEDNSSCGKVTDVSTYEGCKQRLSTGACLIPQTMYMITITKPDGTIFTKQMTEDDYKITNNRIGDKVCQ